MRRPPQSAPGSKRGRQSYSWEHSGICVSPARAKLLPALAMLSCRLGSKSLLLFGGIRPPWPDNAHPNQTWLGCTFPACRGCNGTATMDATRRGIHKTFRALSSWRPLLILGQRRFTDQAPDRNWLGVVEGEAASRCDADHILSLFEFVGFKPRSHTTGLPEPEIAVVPAPLRAAYSLLNQHGSSPGSAGEAAKV